MKGKLYYEKENEKKILKIIEGNSELQGYYAFLSTNESSTTIYNYLAIIKNFLNHTSKMPDQLGLDDFSSYMLYKQTTKEGNISSSSYRVGIYHALKNMVIIWKRKVFCQRIQWIKLNGQHIKSQKKLFREEKKDF